MSKQPRKHAAKDLADINVNVNIGSGEASSDITTSSGKEHGLGPMFAPKLDLRATPKDVGFVGDQGSPMKLDSPNRMSPVNAGLAKSKTAISPALPKSDCWELKPTAGSLDWLCDLESKISSTLDKFDARLNAQAEKMGHLESTLQRVLTKIYLKSDILNDAKEDERLKAKSLKNWRLNLQSEIPEFAGNFSDTGYLRKHSTFFTAVKVFMDESPLPDVQKWMTIMSKLKGTASEWWRQSMGTVYDGNSNVSAAVETLKLKFMPMSARTEVYECLNGLKQGSMLPRAFAQKFLELGASLGETDKHWMALAFSSNINPNLKRMMLNSGIKLEDYNAMIDYCITCADSCHRAESSQSSAKVAKTKTIFSKVKNKNVDATKIKCFVCGNFGHFARNCAEKKISKVNGSKPFKKTVTMAASAKVIRPSVINQLGVCCFMSSVSNSFEYFENSNNKNKNLFTFVIDSGASEHFLGSSFSKIIAKRIHETEKVVNTADGTQWECFETNVISFYSNFNKLLSLRCLYVPQFCDNLLSVSQLNKNGISLTFEENCCELKRDNVVLAHGNMGTDNLYRIKLSTESQRNMEFPITLEKNLANMKRVQLARLATLHGDCSNISKALKVNAQPLSKELQKWHEMFGHCGVRKLKFILKNNKINVPVPEQFYCEACQSAKQTRKQKNVKSTNETIYSLGELLHMDICGPIKPNTPGGSRYVLNIVEESTRYCFSYFLGTKEGPTVMNKIIETVNWLKTQINVSVKRLRSDKGTEFTNQGLADFCTEHGIVQEFTNAYTPSQNGTVERINRTLMDIVRSWLTL
jgi:Integrase core domain/Zinc knuckle